MEINRNLAAFRTGSAGMLSCQCLSKEEEIGIVVTASINSSVWVEITRYRLVTSSSKSLMKLYFALGVLKNAPPAPKKRRNPQLMGREVLVELIRDALFVT